MSLELDKESYLMEAAKNGDDRAFALLIKPYESKVFALLLRYSGNPTDAEDLFQEVFLRVWKSLKGFEWRSSFSTWLTRIAINAAISFQSKRQEVQSQYIPTEIELQNEESMSSNQAEIGFKASLSDEHSPLKEILDAALKKLSPQMRSALLLKYQEGYKIKEIAEILNCSEGAVKRYLFDATLRVKEELVSKKVLR
ncbi:MAG: RNA polymerase sigma factor [Chloroherpetonaceae bacterium]|nr:RNA polymerase sigma factor [Chloroherpetonaceae bacterium]